MYKEALIRNTYQGILANRPRDLTEEELEALAVAEKELGSKREETSLELSQYEKCHVDAGTTQFATGVVADISNAAVVNNTKDVLNDATCRGDGDAAAGGRRVVTGGLGLPPLPESVAAQKARGVLPEKQPSLKEDKEGEPVGAGHHRVCSVLDSPMSRITAHTMSNAPSTPQLNNSHSRHPSTAATGDGGVHTHMYMCEEMAADAHRSQTPLTVTSTCSHDLHLQADGPHDAIILNTNTAAAAAVGAKAKYIPPSRRGGASPAIGSTCAPEGHTTQAPRIRLGHEEATTNIDINPNAKTLQDRVTVHEMSEELRENSISFFGASTTTFFCSPDDRSGAAVSAATGVTRTFVSSMAKTTKTEELVAIKYSLPQRQARDNDNEDDEKPSVPLSSVRGPDAVEALRGVGAATNETSPSAGAWNWVEDNEDEFYEMLNEHSEDFTANSLSVMCAQQNKNPSQKLIVLSSRPSAASRQGGASAQRQKGPLPPLSPSAATSAPHRRGGGANSRKNTRQQVSHDGADEAEDHNHNHNHNRDDDDHHDEGSADEHDARRGGHKGGRSAKSRGKGRGKGKRDHDGTTATSSSVTTGNTNSSNRGPAHVKGKGTNSPPSASEGRFDSLKS